LVKPRSATPTALLDLARNRRVGIVLLVGIGNVVHGLPIANDLKPDDPSRMVVWVAEPAPARVLEHYPAVDEIVVFHKRRGVRGVIELAKDGWRRSGWMTSSIWWRWSARVTACARQPRDETAA
jgi:hypothetical protein